MYNPNRFNEISVNANSISVRLKSKRQRINTVTYLRDILTPLVGVVFKHKIQEPLIYKLHLYINGSCI